MSLSNDISALFTTVAVILFGSGLVTGLLLGYAGACFLMLEAAR